MKNLFKKYCLFVAEKPIEKAIIIGSLLFIVAVLVITSLFGKTEKGLALDSTAMYTAVFFTILLSIFDLIITGLNVTSFYENRERIILIYKDEKIEKYEKPLWGKYPYKIIDLPYGWSVPLSKGESKGFETTVKIRVNKQIATILLKFNFLVYKEFATYELSSLIAFQSEGKKNAVHFDFKKCIEFVFNNHNQGLGNLSAIEAIISDRFSLDQSGNELIEKIREKINFPKFLFDNTSIIIDVVDIKLQLACCIDF